MQINTMVSYSYKFTRKAKLKRTMQDIPEMWDSQKPYALLLRVDIYKTTLEDYAVIQLI